MVAPLGGVEVLPKFRPGGTRISGVMKCYPSLGQGEPESPGVMKCYPSLGQGEPESPGLKLRTELPPMSRLVAISAVYCRSRCVV